MMSRLVSGMTLALLLVAGAAAAVDSADEFLEIVRDRADRGEISSEEALLLKFRYCFDRAELPPDLQPTTRAAMKCATPLVLEFLATRDRLGDDTVAAIEAYLAPPSGSRDVHVSPGGAFLINYVTVGPDAVPTTDADSDGVPDFVERIAEYCDFSLEFECETLGFTTPPAQAAGGTMSISLTDLDGVYGYTSPLSSPPGMTRITMDNDFVGYAPNDDPDGNELGAAKVTAAHEFKHSTQYAGSFWSEGGWVEVDATWMEEIAYPQVNDYVNYLPYGSPISNCNVALDGGSTGTGSYEDCVWQHHLSQVHGDRIIVDFWEWRKSHRTQPVMDSYEQMLRDNGTDLSATWNAFTAWNFATGIRWIEGVGYAESDIYPTGSVQRTVMSYPHSYNGFVTHLAANFIRCLNVSDPALRLKITFDGADAADMTLAAVVNESYATHAGDLVLVPLDGANDAEFVLPQSMDGVYSVGFVVGNAAKIGANMTYSVTIEKVDTALAVGDAASALAIAGNHPNPFNPSTSIEFVLEVAGRAALEIYDVAGRKVRTLVAADLAAGRHVVEWRGRDDGGRSLPSGSYLARLRSGGRVTSHKLVLAR